ncbi:MAG: hypothetical protein IKZ45_05400 [Fibrobacter sp.]|nr:hypothetical protein [Fibrobacter sp.]
MLKVANWTFIILGIFVGLANADYITQCDWPTQYNSNDTIAEQNAVQTEMQDSVKTKPRDFTFIYVFGGGFSSSQDLEVDLLVYNHNLFNSKRFFFQYSLFRMDVKTREDGEETNIGVSLGSLLANLVFGLLPQAFDNERISGLSKPLIWLSSGGTEFCLLGFPLMGISIAETHAFKWYFLRNHIYDDKAHIKFQFDDIGYSEEFGLKLGLVLATLSGGVRIEATTKGVDVGWFVKGLVLPFFPDFY